jgi:hypothetical protein
LKAEGNVEETMEYEPLKKSEAPSDNVRETQRVRMVFGEKLEAFLHIHDKAVANMKANKTVPLALRAWIGRTQLGGICHLLRVRLGTKKHVGVLMPLINAVTEQ